MIEIVSVQPHGRAAGLGIKPGDSLVSINGQEIHDVIDYTFYAADERLTMTLKTREGASRKATVIKEPDDDLGLECASFRIKRCRNRCIFCFVDQMPKGCRTSLYVKDDDFRASFLYGNYITLGSLAEQDWERIARQRLSPLYISVHATDPALRSFILGNKKAPDIMLNLKRLAASGIRMHTQVVLCPGINDGPRLVRTIEDLSGLFPMVNSIAVVPVGLTARRNGLFPLKPVAGRSARAVIEIVKQLGARYREKFGTRLVFASDEFYIKAAEPVPPASFYEDFPQIENGVGMASKFIREAVRTRVPAKTDPVTLTVVTGVSFSRMLNTVLTRFEKTAGITVKLVTVKNRFFGPSVTVAGLLTGRDILNALKGRRPGSLVMIPSNALKEDEDVFLDGMSLASLEQSLGAPVRRVEGFSDMVALLRRGERRGEHDFRENKNIRHLRLSRGAHLFSGNAQCGV